jgi:hypothetical protein
MGTAIRLAKTAAGIPESDPITLKRYPRPKAPPLGMMQMMFSGEEPESSDEEGAVRAMARVFRAAEPVFSRLRALTLSQGELVLLAPELEIR